MRTRLWSSFLAPAPAVACAIALLAPIASIACGSGADEPYKPTPAWSGRKPSLPSVPSLSTQAKKVGDAYTIFGAIHDLKSRIHSAEITAKDVNIQGYIVQSNIPEAPKCAIHKTGKKDPDDCTDVPIPSFWIADNKGDNKGQMIRVLGWAKNFASVYEAMEKYKNLKDPPKELYKDDVWSVDVPFPLPAVGAKVKVTGKYGYTFSKSTTGLVSDPNNGVMTYSSMQVLDATGAEPAAFDALKPGGGKK
jgi:hypothetical protein